VRREITEFPDIVIPADELEHEVSLSDIWPRRNPLEVDIGAGKGRFLFARAMAHPETDYLGIERQYGRVYRAAKKAHRRGLTNIRIARVDAETGIAPLLPPESVRTFYIFFPDPWPKRRHQRRRLVNHTFLDLLHTKLLPGGFIHFATDHENYAEAVKLCFSEDPRFDGIAPFQPTEAERTDFELIFTGQNRTVSRFSLQKR